MMVNRLKCKILIKYILRKIIETHLKFIRYLWQDSPVPLNYWLLYYKMAHIVIKKWKDPLSPTIEAYYDHSSYFKIEELKNLFFNATFDKWALDTDSITVIWRNLWKQKPVFILECGSGVSTVVLAKYASLVSSHGENCLVVSLEQSREGKKNTEACLEAKGLKHFAKVLYAPLDNKEMYSINEFRELLLSLPYKSVDLLLIDGPAGLSLCRYRTLPTLKSFCQNNAKWFLDDAFRDGELWILQQWQNFPDVIVEGIYPIGKGLGTGIVKR